MASCSDSWNRSKSVRRRTSNSFLEHFLNTYPSNIFSTPSTPTIFGGSNQCGVRLPFEEKLTTLTTRWRYFPATICRKSTYLPSPRNASHGTSLLAFAPERSRYVHFLPCRGELPQETRSRLEPGWLGLQLTTRFYFLLRFKRIIQSNSSTDSFLDDAQWFSGVECMA
jgi:hypothetical protein